MVSFDRSPDMTMFPLYLMFMVSLFTMAVHPASHNCPIDISECVFNSGTTCVNVAAGGNVGMSKCPSCVDVIVLPSGMVMVIGAVVMCLSMSGVSGVHKCVVHPVSRIILVSVGGPTIADDVKCVVLLLTSLFIFLLSSLLSLGSPPRQLFVFWCVLLLALWLLLLLLLPLLF